MLKHKDHFHGSDLEKIEQYYGIKKETIVSFSANVNPLGISPNLRETLCAHLDAITSYPDREYASLRRWSSTKRILQNTSIPIWKTSLSATAPQN